MPSDQRAKSARGFWLIPLALSVLLSFAVQPEGAFEPGRYAHAILSAIGGGFGIYLVSGLIPATWWWLSKATRAEPGVPFVLWIVAERQAQEKVRFLKHPSRGVLLSRQGN